MANFFYFQIDSQEVKCAICHGLWIDKDARILPCQHSFCYECLLEQEKHSISYFTCALCRYNFKLRNFNINNLPKNLLCKSMKIVAKESIKFNEIENLKNLTKFKIQQIFNCYKKLKEKINSNEKHKKILKDIENNILESIEKICFEKIYEMNLIIIHEIKLFDHCQFVYLTDYGYYSKWNTAHNKIVVNFQNFDNTYESFFILEQPFDSLLMSEKNLYALDKDGYIHCINLLDRKNITKLYLGDKPAKYYGLWAVGEDEFDNECFIALNSKTYQFDYYINNQYKKSIDGKEATIVAIVNHGNIIIYRRDCLILYDKNQSAEVFRKFIPGIKNIWTLSSTNIIMSRGNKLWVTDVQLGKSHQLKWPFTKIRGISKSGKICLKKNSEKNAICELL